MAIPDARYKEERLLAFMIDTPFDEVTGTQRIDRLEVET
jgi:hypothetical protein